jgi:hypothetical protein
MSKLIYTGIRAWIPLGIAITLLSLFIYGAIQQVIRTGANDPQIQLAEDLANKLADGEAIPENLTADKVDIARSLSPFIIVFDSNKQVVASSAVLNNNNPVTPKGVLDYAREHGENRVTWQPQTGVRMAIVAIFYNDKAAGYVVVGRSLRENEIRTAKIGNLIQLGWAATLLFTLLAKILFGYKIEKINT